MWRGEKSRTPPWRTWRTGSSRAEEQVKEQGDEEERGDEEEQDDAEYAVAEAGKDEQFLEDEAYACGYFDDRGEGNQPDQGRVAALPTVKGPSAREAVLEEMQPNGPYLPTKNKPNSPTPKRF